MTRRVRFSMMLGLLCLAVGINTPLQSAVASTGSTARASYTTLSTTDFESRLVALTNARRQAHGCRALRRNSALVLAARRHSTRMSEDRVLSHRLAGEPGLGTRVTRAGYTNWRIVAENIAWGQATPRAVFRAWMASAGHRANIDNCRLRDIGLGVVYRNGRPWVTQDFGRRS